MSSSESRTEVIKPLLQKAGIQAATAALSIAAYICARIISKRQAYSQQNCHYPECEDQNTTNLQVGNYSNLEGKLLELETQLEDFRKRDSELEMKFIRYRDMKEREFALMEIKNSMLLEKNRAEFFLKEISLMEDENKKIGGLIIEYIKLFHQLQGLKLENGLLQRIDNRVQELEAEVGQLKEVIDQLKREKIELLNKREIAENSDLSNSKVEIEGSTKDYDKVMQEPEREEGENSNQTERGNDKVHDRWIETCNITNIPTSSKRKKLINKLRNGLKGKKMDDKEKNEIKCFGKHFVSEEAEEPFIHARKSCSSV